MSELLWYMRGVSKSFPGVRALDGMNLNLYKGEVHMVLGENGVRKSTLLKVISGVYKRDEGSIAIEGKETEINNTLDTQHKGIGIVYQESNVSPQLTVAQNIFIGREARTCIPLQIDEKPQRTNAKDSLQQLNARFSPNQKISNFSVAEKHMTEIAKALSFSIKTLIMDEPTIAFTESETQRSSELPEVISMSDCIGVMHEGQMGTEVEAECTSQEEIMHYGATGVRW